MNALLPAARAAHEQLMASDPQVSAFVSAHAGAGKTKLLIDRLLRLMLAGADPARILCLTFTKAAAAEMAIRLQKRLAGFVTLSDVALDDALKALLLTPSTQTRQRARALFAHVLDLPGGMRISTTHAFCQSLLRRFPLEAEMSPHFQLVEDAQARAALDQAREAVLPRADPAAIAALAGLASADGFAALTAVLEKNRERLRIALALPPASLQAALNRAVGVQHGTEAELIGHAVRWPGEAALRDALRRCRLFGSPGVMLKAGDMEGWLNLPESDRPEYWEQWLKHLFNADGKATAVSKFCNANLAKAHPDICGLIEAEQARAAAVLQSCQALRCAAASGALLALAAPILSDYAATKARGGLVDYDDLIRRTVALLKDAGAAWVKYKLDGGIDHLLLDEVQDTSSVQWDVTDALTEDFFTGEGARGDFIGPRSGNVAARSLGGGTAAITTTGDITIPNECAENTGPGRGRTVFAVGDIKQSIYSFQGAEPDEFDKRRARYARQIKNAGMPWRETVLDVSFRSTAPVLTAVDAVFAAAASSCGVCGPGGMSHLPNRVGQAGSVVVWPLAPRPEAAAAAPWTIPERNQGARSAAEDLVRHLAAWIAARIDSGTMLESAGRPVRAGDFLVLVRRRGQFDRALVRELKKRGVNVAGLDRMKLTDQLAVQDLLSLCQALLLPQDDLSFAEMLTSPLGDLSDDSLMALSAGRRTTLWETLRTRHAERADWRQAHDFFAALLARVDFASPYAMLAEALGPLQGRARLFARLGPEAAEPVDELLASAQSYAADHPPSLQGFLDWLERSGAEVKREAEAGGDVLRIMTVHGAKGLEAPIVILPDTASLPPDEDRLHWTQDAATGAELFLWVPNKAFRCDAVDRLAAATTIRRMEEYNRLLYVAMTRARDHLLVCGWQPRGEVPEDAWYAQICHGLHAAGAQTVPHEWGDALVLEAPQTAAPEGETQRPTAPGAAIPAWAGDAPTWQPHPLPAEPALPRPLAPSRPENAGFGAVPPSRSPLVREQADRPAARGSLVHALLQHLPDLPPGEWEQAATAFACQSIPAEATHIAAEVTAVLRDPSLAALFGPGSRAEQGLTGVVGGVVMTGRVDRLAILADRVIVADYKTARTPPASPAQVPVLYLRQMAAYRALLRLLYAEREIICVLVWTEGPVAMTLPSALLDQHAPGAGLRAEVLQTA
jgi:ATP-dependent helicase/nuclease subunit A